MKIKLIEMICKFFIVILFSFSFHHFIIPQFSVRRSFHTVFQLLVHNFYNVKWSRAAKSRGAVYIH